jgi:folate-dependent tRNA-U54 methylase TrmFO/GidA
VAGRPAFEDGTEGIAFESRVGVDELEACAQVFDLEAARGGGDGVVGERDRRRGDYDHEALLGALEVLDELREGGAARAAGLLREGRRYLETLGLAVVEEAPVLGGDALATERRAHRVL